MNILKLFSGKKAMRLGLAMGGGGAKGIAHIAFLKVLDDMGIRPAVISGTSIGALIGALYASGHNGLGIERIFLDLNLVNLIGLVDVTLGAKYGLIRGEKIIKTLGKLTRNMSFEDLKIPLKVVATDFWSREEIIFNHGNLLEAVRASISIPGIFEPVLADGRVLIDGGAVNSLPYEILRDECDVLVAINVLGEIAPRAGQAVKPTLAETIFYTLQIMENANVANKLSRTQPDIYISPRLFNVQALDFHKVKEILDSVAEDEAQFRKQLEKFPCWAKGGKQAPGTR